MESVSMFNISRVIEWVYVAAVAVGFTRSDKMSPRPNSSLYSRGNQLSVRKQSTRPHRAERCRIT